MLLIEFDSECGAYFISVAVKRVVGFCFFVFLIVQCVKALYNTGCVHSCVFS